MDHHTCSSAIRTAELYSTWLILTHLEVLKFLSLFESNIKFTLSLHATLDSHADSASMLSFKGFRQMATFQRDPKSKGLCQKTKRWMISVELRDHFKGSTVVYRCRPHLWAGKWLQRVGPKKMVVLFRSKQRCCSTLDNQDFMQGKSCPSFLVAAWHLVAGILKAQKSSKMQLAENFFRGIALAWCERNTWTSQASIPQRFKRGRDVTRMIQSWNGLPKYILVQTPWARCS